MTDIPVAELQQVGRRHSIDYDYSFDPTTVEVRRLAAEVRASAADSIDSAGLLAEADDLEALAARHEREADA